MDLFQGRMNKRSLSFGPYYSENLDIVKREVGSVKAQLATSRTEADGLKAQNNSLKMELDDVRSKVDTLARQLGTVTKQLDIILGLIATEGMAMEGVDDGLLSAARIRRDNSAAAARQRSS